MCGKIGAVRLMCYNIFFFGTVYSFISIMVSRTDIPILS